MAGSPEPIDEDRFTRPGPQHPTYTALLELGRAVTSVVVARYLAFRSTRSGDQRRAAVVENWNPANDVPGLEVVAHQGADVHHVVPFAGLRVGGGVQAVRIAPPSMRWSEPVMLLALGESR